MIIMTSSSAISWFIPTLWGLNLVLSPHTRAYLQSLAKVLRDIVILQTGKLCLPVDAVTDPGYVDTAPEDDSVVEIRRLAGLLGVDPDQLEFLPQHLHQVVKVETL